MDPYTAAAHTDKAKEFVAKFESIILFPIITLMISVSLMVFLFGAYEFVLGAENDGAREKGRLHMMYGIIGFLVMLSALAILKIAAGTFGLTVPE